MRIALLRSFALIARGFSICLFAAFLLAGTAIAQTQITTGTIQGTVLDANGAALPGAGVVVKNVDTNFERSSTTDEDGRFIALQLPPGRYTLTVTKTGFATLVVERADVTVGQALNLPLSMKVSTVAETVTITATPTVDTVKTESSTTLNETVVNTTPILGRKFEDLLTLRRRQRSAGTDGVRSPSRPARSFQQRQPAAATTTTASLVNNLAARAAIDIRWTRSRNFRWWPGCRRRIRPTAAELST